MQRFLPVFVALFVCFGCSKKIVSVQDLDNSLSDTYKSSLFAGIALTVVKEDKVLFQKSYGQADVAKNTAYTNQTIQPIASVSKTFIGVAMMKAIEQGFFTLETNINDVLPFLVKNPNSPNVPIKIKHLVTHTSGIVDVQKTYYKSHSILSGQSTTSAEAQRMINELGFGQNSSILPLKDFIKAYFTEGGASYSPDNFLKNEAGAAYSYSNIGAALAAYLIEIKAGKPFADYCDETIFRPLNMNNTKWTIAAANPANLAKLYWTKEKPLPYYGAATYPDGGLVTNSEDLTKFMLEMLKGYSGTSSFLKKESFDLMFKKAFPSDKLPANMEPKEVNAGVFWVYFKNGRLGHTGGDLGVTTFMVFYPETKTGFIFLSNTEVENSDQNKTIATQLNEMLSAIKEFEGNN